MAERQRIGLTFSYDEEWIAGTYYVLNIIHALKLLQESEQPEVIIISEDKKNYDIVKKETAYSWLNFFKFPEAPPTYTTLERLVNKFGLAILRKKIVNKSPKLLQVDFVYPFHIGDYPIVPKKQVNWVPDFQEVHLPNLFSEEVIAQRKHRLEAIVCQGDWVVFSSKDSQNDFSTLQPNAKVSQFVLPFAVTHPDFDFENIQNLRDKHLLPERYYFAPNQFWAHKNHMVILKAIKNLKAKGLDVVVAFSGKENDHRNMEYTTQLKQFINDFDLTENVRFLGFLPRTEQLKLMQGALAIVQPSKFEGWSTVVEDAKAINQFLLLSNLRVHREQTQNNVQFFEPEDYETLSSLMETYWAAPPVIETIDYEAKKLDFGRNFLKLAKAVTTNI